jgi:lysophospholipase L1-like esterase
MIDLGLPSETVSGLTEPNHAGGAFPRPDLHERLARALAKIKPDLVVACYGMNDGIYHPFDEGRLKAYKDGIQWLQDSVVKTGAKIWFLTPPPFDPQPDRASLWPARRDSYPSGHTFEGYDGVLANYSKWLVAQRKNGWKVIDIHTPINAYVAERRVKEPGFALSGDGVHINNIGHMLIAREILRSWGAPKATLSPIEPNASPSELEKLVHERGRLLTDAWLTDVGHKRPGMPAGEPLPKALEDAKTLEGRIQALTNPKGS